MSGIINNHPHQLIMTAGESSSQVSWGAGVTALDALHFYCLRIDAQMFVRARQRRIKLWVGSCPMLDLLGEFGV